MDLPQIGYFLTLSRVLNFTRAAEECHITQPAFSRAIRRLEVELGSALLFRERAQTQLTDFGRAMLPYLEQIEIAADIARREAEQYRAQDSAPFRLGLSPWVSLPLINPLLIDVVKVVKQTEFSLTVESRQNLRERMLQGQLDVIVAMGVDTPPQRFNQWRLLSSCAAVFVSTDHRIATKSELQIDDLAAESFLGAFEPDSLPEILLSHLARCIGGRPQTPHRVGNWESCLQLVRAGLGCGLGSFCWAVPPDLVALPLLGKQFEHDVVIETLAGRPKSAAATVFVKLARANSWL